jgi:Uma2 family endonuclease
MTTSQRMTFEDLMALPDDECLHELVRGEIICMPPPKTNHGYVEFDLADAINRYLYDRAVALGWDQSQGRVARNELVGRVVGGEAGVRFTLPDDPDQTRGMDLAYLSPAQLARLKRLDEDEYIDEVPELVAEVVSPSNPADYMDEKVHDYLAGGARMVWLLFPKTRTVTVYRADGVTRRVPADGVLDGEDVLPGFSERLSNIFA